MWTKVLSELVVVDY